MYAKREALQKEVKAIEVRLSEVYGLIVAERKKKSSTPELDKVTIEIKSRLEAKKKELLEYNSLIGYQKNPLDILNRKLEYVETNNEVIKLLKETRLLADKVDTNIKKANTLNPGLSSEISNYKSNNPGMTMSSVIEAILSKRKIQSKGDVQKEIDCEIKYQQEVKDDIAKRNQLLDSLGK